MCSSDLRLSSLLFNKNTHGVGADSHENFRLSTTQSKKIEINLSKYSDAATEEIPRGQNCRFDAAAKGLDCMRRRSSFC